MTDQECIRFLQWALPKLRYRWAGFRRVRRQVCKRLGRRLAELALPDLTTYRTYLVQHPNEWRVLDAACRVTISRFYRDKGVWGALRSAVLPDVLCDAQNDGADEVRCWCAGCGSGEEPYTLRMAWVLDVAHEANVGLALRITASDSNTDLLERARRGVYTSSSLRSLPREWVGTVFESSPSGYTIRPEHKEGIDFVEQDIRREMPAEMFRIVFCRNLVFTYFDESLQREVAAGIERRLVPNGFLIVGVHESLPPGTVAFEPLDGVKGVYIMRRSA
jgi:chemotaxis protein methyltransferase CheR